LTREDTIRLIGIITMAYPNFDKFRDEKHIRSLVQVWADMFADDEPGLVAMAVKTHISTSKWPPSIAEIREIMARITNPNIIPPERAWEIVAKYLFVKGEFGDSFNIQDELPPAIADTVNAIGYSQLYELNRAYVYGGSSKAGLGRLAFIQAYTERIERMRTDAIMPASLKTKIAAASAEYENGDRLMLESIDRRYDEKRQNLALLFENNPLLDDGGGSLLLTGETAEDDEDV